MYDEYTKAGAAAPAVEGEKTVERKNIVVLFGGCSPEYGVSLESASGVLEHIDLKKYRPVPVGITREGDWYWFGGDWKEIGADTWADSERLAPAALSPNRSEHALLVFRESGVERVPVDGVFPVLHGGNGEDGTVQGLCELAGIPLVGCGTLASALGMDKDRAHKLAALAGVAVPASFVLEPDFAAEEALSRAEGLGYPLFVKPVKAGSSFGVTRVAGPEDLLAAVNGAFRYDGEVIVEEAIPGFEVGCAVMGHREPVVGEVDEIELAGGFFDFTEKYNLITSQIHVPARIAPEKAGEIKEAARKIYRALGCRGFARVDMFLTPEGKIVFNEVNTIPGFTAHSRFPSMMAAAGISFEAVLDRVIGEAVGT